MHIRASMFDDMQRQRVGMRLRDIAESKQLLHELVTLEPTMLQCFGIVEAMCLSHGIHCKIDGQPVTPAFDVFLRRFWGSFLRDSVRMFYAYGFVPWTVIRNSDGDDVPVVVPVGSFDWWSEPRPTTAGAIVQETAQGLLCYRVRPDSSIGVQERAVRIYRFAPPTHHVASNSFLSATVSSPMAHVLTDYRHLRQAQLRRAYADSWNTTAKLICSFKPAPRVQEDPSACLMDFADDSYFDPTMNLVVPGMAPLQATNMWTRDAQIRKQFEGVSTHAPDVFTLPKDHDVVQQHMLTPCEDIELLLAQFQRNVCAVVGIPEEMVLTRSKARQADTVHRTLAAGRIFSCNMKQVCVHLEELAQSAYADIYGKCNSSFTFVPMPRLEVDKVEDLKILFEIGALDPDVSLGLTDLLLGEELATGKRRAALAKEHTDLRDDLGGEGGAKRLKRQSSLDEGKDVSKAGKGEGGAKAGKGDGESKTGKMGGAGVKKAPPSAK